MTKLRTPAFFKEKELWLLVFIGILYFHRPLFLGETLFLRDLYSNVLPQKQLLVDFFAAGELPLWNPYLNGGQAYLGNIANAVIDPFNVLYLSFPLFDAFNLDIILRVILCAVLAYAFARATSLAPVPSLVVGIVYGFCGYTLSLLNVLNLLRAMMWLPALLWGWHLFFKKSGKWWFVCAVFIGTLQLFSGAPEISALSLLMLLGWSVFYPYSHCSIRDRVLSWGLLGVFISGVALVQILPTIEILLQSPRAGGLSFPSFSYWSLSLKRLPELFLPGFLGHVDTLNDADYWGRRLVDGSFPCILSIYFGVSVLVLAMIGCFLHDNNRRAWPFKLRIFLFVTFISSLLLSLGRFLPLFSVIYDYIPFIEVFRYPIKFLSAGILPVALLAGYAVETLFGRRDGALKRFEVNVASMNHFGEANSPKVFEKKPYTTILPALWSILVILFILTMTFIFSESFSNYFQQFFFNRTGGAVAFFGIKSALLHSVIVCAAITILFQYRALYRRKWQQWILVGILLVDLLSAGKRLNPTSPREFFSASPASVQLVRSRIEEGRFFRTSTPSNVILSAPSNSIHWRYLWNLEVLDSYLAAYYQIPFIFHDDLVKFVPKSILKLHVLSNILSWRQRLPILSAGGVSVILTEDEGIATAPGIKKIAEIPNRSNLRSFLFFNERAASRVEFVAQWKLVNSDSKALAAMLEPGYNPRQHAIIQLPSPLFSLARFRKDTSMVSVSSESNKSCLPSQIQRIRGGWNKPFAVYSISNNCDGFLVFSEPYYPGWKLSVDGKSASAWRANYAFSGIFLEEGEHLVERYYLPDSLLLGGGGSLMFLGLLIFMAHKEFFVIKVN